MSIERGMHEPTITLKCAACGDTYEAPYELCKCLTMGTPLSDVLKPSDPLDTVRKATQQRQQTEQAWKRALRDARAQGLTVRQIGAAAGVSHQRVHQLTTKGNHYGDS